MVNIIAIPNRKSFGVTIVVGESFEDGALPPLSAARGAVSISSGSLLLGPGGALTLGPSFGIDSAIIVEADVDGDRSSCSVVLATPERGRVLSVGGTGDVGDFSGKTVGSIASANGRVAFSVEFKDGELYLRGASGSRPIVMRCAVKRFTLSLERAGGSGRASFDRILVRDSVPPSET